MRSILRILIGILFITSGIVKAIDPVGFSVKLDEYFSPEVFNLPFLESAALPIAMLISGLEVLLGVMLVFRIKLKSTIINLIGLCVFFAFLTFYSAYFDVVKDCGCFGDAIKFKPWESFAKDMILLTGLIILWFAYKKSKYFDDSTLSSTQKGIIGITILLLSIIMYIGVSHEPIIDFRDYKIGTDLNAEKKKIDDDPSEYKTVYVLKNKKTNEEKQVDQDEYLNNEDYWKEGTDWEILSDKTSSVLVKQGYKSEIEKFVLTDADQNDVTSEILQAPKVVLLCSYDPKALSAEDIKEAEDKVKNQPLVYGVSPQADTYKEIPNLTMDGTAIKTIARSNPFVMVIENGIITEKESIKDYNP